jgi:Asp-tRNA(Asn)/Glu-tRNA(Gln) amidotransferase A subunit family amidase
MKDTITSTEAVTQYLHRISARDFQVRAWAFLDPDQALRQAKEADATTPRI